MVGCEKLQTFNIAHNLISSVPAELAGLLHLKDLDIAHNQLVTMPRAIYEISTLSKINIEGNEGYRQPSKSGKRLQLPPVETGSTDGRKAAPATERGKNHKKSPTMTPPGNR